MLAAVTLMFLCSLLGVRYYLIFKNKSLFENKVEDKIQYFEQLLQYEQITQEMFTYDEQVLNTVRNFFVTRNDLELNRVFYDLMPSFDVSSVWLYNSDFSLLYYQCPVHKIKTKDCGLNKVTLTKLFQRGSYYRHFFKITPAGLMEIRTVPIEIPDKNKTAYAPPGILISGRLWSNNQAVRLAKKANAAEIQILPVSKGFDLRPKYTPATGRITFSKILPGWDRRPLKRMFVAYETPIIREFNQSSNIQMAALFVFTFVIIVMLIFCFSRWIMTPLKAISQALETKSSEPVNAITKQQTEFGRIGRMIQEFFQQQESLIKEINERKKIAEALENSTDAIGMSTFQGHHYYQNKAFDQLFGDIGSNPTDTVYVDKDVGVEVFNIIKSGDIWTGEVKMRSRNGQILDIDLRAYANKDENGNIISLVGVHSDITERKKAEAQKRKLEAQLLRAEKMETIGTLAGGVAHDLNNVLSGIISYPELLLMNITEDSPLREPLMTIKKSGERAAAIVQDLLTLARRGIIINEVVNLNTIITAYTESAEYKIIKNFHSGVAIELRLADDLLNILGSPIHLTKTVMNLLSNAAESISDSGTVNMSTENKYLDRPLKDSDNIREGEYVVLRISDSGSGISQQDIGKIFEPFYTKKAMGRSGTGLGLAVVWGTVKDHNGYIEIASSEDEGTTFTLYFPVTRKETEKVKKELSPEVFQGQGESILIVDDVAEQREIASKMLQNLNYSVSSVSSGEEAIKYMNNNSVNLLVLDMIINPGIDGLEIYKKILEIHPGQKAIIASGFSETDRVKEAQNFGAGAYIKKPYTLEKIGVAIKNELKKQSIE